MLEFTLLARDSENYNIINWVPDGDIDRVLRACGAHFRGRNWTFLPYSVALDVGVNPINGNLLLRGPLGAFSRPRSTPHCRLWRESGRSANPRSISELVCARTSALRRRLRCMYADGHLRSCTAPQSTLSTPTRVLVERFRRPTV